MFLTNSFISQVFIFSLFFIIEYFLYYLFGHIFQHTKSWKVQNIAQLFKNTWKEVEVSSSSIIFFLYLYTLKGSVDSNEFEFSCLNFLLLFISASLFSFSYGSNFNINGVVISFVISSFFLLLDDIESLSSFLFFVELLSILYYFFFLSFINFSTKNYSIKFKNLLVLYLWNSLLTTLFFIFGCYMILLDVGTLVFEELNLFSNYNGLGPVIIFFSLCWKLGLPVFNFYKLQLYKYLLADTLFVFSLISLVVNVGILHFYLEEEFVLNTIFLFKVNNYILLFSLVMLFRFLRVSSFYLFIGLSSVLTLNFSLILYCL